MKRYCMMLTVACAVLLTPLTGGQAAGPNVLENGGFDTPDISGSLETLLSSPPGFGWDVTSDGSAGVDLINEFWRGIGGTVNPDGNDQSVDLDGESSVAQSFTTIPGSSYTLTFSYSHNYLRVSSSGSVTVQGGDGALIAEALFHNDDNSGDGMKWVQFSRTFVADSASTTLVIQGDAANGLYGFAVDNVSARSEAEPTTTTSTLTTSTLPTTTTLPPADEPIPAKVILIKFGGKPGEKVGKVASIVSKVAGALFTLPASPNDPGTLGGSMRFDVGPLGQIVCDLPAGTFDGKRGWKSLGKPSGSKGYKYTNKDAPSDDPCKVVLIKEKLISAVLKGTQSLLPPLDEDLNPDVSVVLEAGSQRYCAYATAPHFKEKLETLIKATEQMAPGSCPGTTSTTASSTTTTSTTTTTTSTTTTTLRFVDNGDGTVTDNQTGLMWEKKDDAGGIHDLDNLYSWAGCCDGDCENYPGYCQPNAAAAAACIAQAAGGAGCGECPVGTCDVSPYYNGAITTIWDWLAQLNTAGFAGRSDWRLPSQEGCNSCSGCYCDPRELETIVLEPYPCATQPCVDAVFNTSCGDGCTVTACSCTASSTYWSSTHWCSYPCTWAWYVDFSSGAPWFGYKGYTSYVRAVRDL